jgi:hypothetical protein
VDLTFTVIVTERTQDIARFGVEIGLRFVVNALLPFCRERILGTRSSCDDNYQKYQKKRSQKPNCGVHLVPFVSLGRTGSTSGGHVRRAKRDRRRRRSEYVVPDEAVILA